MKKLLLAISIATLFLVSCSDETTENLGNKQIQDKVEKGRFDNEPFKWDYTYMPFLAPGEMFIGCVKTTNVISSSQTRNTSSTGRGFEDNRDGRGSSNGEYNRKTNSGLSEYESGLIVQNPTSIYVGATYPLSSIDNGLFDKEVVNLKKNPVRLLFKFPIDFRYQITRVHLNPIDFQLVVI